MVTELSCRLTRVLCRLTRVLCRLPGVLYRLISVLQSWPELSAHLTFFTKKYENSFPPFPLKQC